MLGDSKYRGDVEYFVRWQDERTRVIRDGEHVPIIGDGRDERHGS